MIADSHASIIMSKMHDVHWHFSFQQKTDGLIELVDELLDRTKEYLQPNPATRAKLMLSSKVVQTKTHAYPQPEGTLGESMIRASRRLGVDSSYGMMVIYSSYPSSLCPRVMSSWSLLVSFVYTLFVHFVEFCSLWLSHALRSLSWSFSFCYLLFDVSNSFVVIFLLLIFLMFSLFQARVWMSVEKPWSKWRKSSMLWKTMSSRTSWSLWLTCRPKTSGMFK